MFFRLLHHLRNPPWGIEIHRHDRPQESSPPPRDARDDAAAAEYQKLVRFVQTHYTVAADGTTAVFSCTCEHPDNCSDWQQHPDIDQVLVQVMGSGMQNNPNREAESTTNNTTTTIQEQLSIPITTRYDIFLGHLVAVLGAIVMAMLDAKDVRPSLPDLKLLLILVCIVSMFFVSFRFLKRVVRRRE